MPLRAINDNLIVICDRDEFTSDNQEVNEALKSGKIILPDAFEGFYKKSAMRGTVVSFGSRCLNEFGKGERVIFGRFSGVKIFCQINDKIEEYYVINEKDVLAKEG